MPLDRISPRGFLAFIAGCALTVQMASSSLQKFARPGAPPRIAAASAFVASPIYYAELSELPPAEGGAVQVGAKAEENPVDNPPQEDIELQPPSEQDFLTPEKIAELQPEESSEGPRFVWPVSGSVTSRYGPRGRELHRGIDIGAPYGRTIRAARGGVVTLSGWYYGYGRTVVIRHADGSETLYGHASRLLVSPGQRVEQGQPIALVGSSGRSTGPHLHFEIRIGGQAVNPLNHLGR